MIHSLQIEKTMTKTVVVKRKAKRAGIGVKSARRIIMARRRGTLDFNALKKFGVVLKRAMYFITCHGHMMIPIRLNRTFILANLLGLKERLPKEIEAQGTGRQMMLEDVMQGW